MTRHSGDIRKISVFRIAKDSFLQYNDPMGLVPENRICCFRNQMR